MHVIMRVSLLLLALALVIGAHTFGRVKPYASTPVVSTISPHTLAPTIAAVTEPAKVDFATQIRPIFEARCTPCHFAGGKMYERLPFDRPETIYKLGTKLFSRIKDEHEQRLIRAFLAQQPAQSHASPSAN